VPSNLQPDADTGVADYFDELYRGEGRYWWRHGDPYATDPDAYPTSLLTQMSLRLIREREPAAGQRPRALDLGAGEGADAIRLARLDYDVTAVDISPEAVKKIEAFAADASVHIIAETADISEYRPQGHFDVIICNGVLHYIADKQKVIERMQAATAPGGLNVVSSWSTFTQVPTCHNSVPVYCDREDGVVARSYASWNLKCLYFEREKPESSHEGMAPHAHSHIKLIAEKPMGQVPA
jgi:2-polyprenyl-3-methyl-5-hydroxy-6-metoxy-1,4-benzoquinol methylase